VDAIRAEIIRNALVAITDEVKTNLMRTAYNMIIYEALDFTVGLVRRRRQHHVRRAGPADATWR
jgi:N-methylhydantoinase B